jgi:haloacid dehalogenase superfamily, subfamily IA, variant 3 with third motif having DD or ED
MNIKNIIFDFGGVLVDWNPQYLYKQVFADKSEMNFFLENICTSEWNARQDAGRSLKEATETLQKQHPEYQKEIQMYYKDWIQMLGGEILENTRLLKPLKKKYRLFGLTNWSAETIPLAYKEYAFFKELEGIVVSGEEKIIKPEKAIFEILLKRYHLKAEESLFIDDNINNIKTAESLGFQTIHLADGIHLDEQLKEMGL